MFMNKKILLLWIILGVLVAPSKEMVSTDASTLIPLVYKSNFSSPNGSVTMEDFVASGFVQAGSNEPYPSIPGILPWQGTNTLHLMPAGHRLKFNSLFLKDKLDISRTEQKGLSTFLEFSIHKGVNQWAGDGFSFVLAKDDFRTKTRDGYSTGLIDNSLAVRFSTWRPHPINSTGLQVSVGKNGLTSDASLIGGYENIDVALGTISPNISAYGLLRIYKMWIDLNAATQTLEIRVRFDNSYERPLLPTVSYPNISMADLTDQFYAGITVSAGGLEIGVFLNQFHLANQFLPNGIDATNLNQYVMDRSGPTGPVINPVQDENGWRLHPSSTDNADGPFQYDYKVDDEPYTLANNNPLIPNGTRQVLIRASDQLNNLSTITTVNFLKATFKLDEETSFDLWYPSSHPPAMHTPSAPTGYSFEGWYSESSLDNEVLALSSTIDQTLFPKWIGLPVTLTFETNGGSSVEAITLPFETSVNAPQAPTKQGHTFDGWYTDEAFLNPYTFTTMPLNPLTLFAKWSINSYRVQFETFGGTQIEDIAIPFGSTFSDLPVSPTLAHAFFDQWYLDLALTQPFEPFVMSDENVTLYARWIDATPVEQLLALVNSWTSPLTLDDETSVIDARQLLDSLTEEQATYVSQAIITLIENAEQRMMDLTTILPFQVGVDNLPETITLEDASTIEALLSLYESFTTNQQALVDPLDYALLIEAEERIDNLLIVSALEQLFIFPSPISLEDEALIVDLRAQYDALTEVQQALFNDELYDTLLEAEAMLANLRAVKQVMDLINAIEKGDLENQSKIIAARQAYNQLTPQQKALLDATYIERLETLEVELEQYIQEVSRQTFINWLLIVHLTSATIFSIIFIRKNHKRWFKKNG